MKAVVTGIGVISPFGVGKEKLLEGLFQGRSAVKRNKDFLDIEVKLFAQVVDFLPSSAFSDLDRNIQFALSACAEALEDAKIAIEDEEIAIIVSSSKGGVLSFEKEHKKLLSGAFVSAEIFKNIMPHSPSLWIKRIFGIKKSFMHSIVSACTTGAVSFIKGAEIIEEGVSKIVLCGASEASITPLIVAGFLRMGVLSKKASHTPSPFDKGRDGFVIGEGAAVFVLEEKEHALKRGAKIYGEVLGYSMGSFGGLVSFDNCAKSIASCIKKAISYANIEPSSIEYISAHGTATKENDRVETSAIKEAFGSHAYTLYISSQKSMIGHTLGASGAIELAGTLLARKAGFIPPTINLFEKDPECDLNYVPNRRKECRFNIFAKLSFGFGGHICCIIMGDGNA